MFHVLCGSYVSGKGLSFDQRCWRVLPVSALLKEPRWHSRKSVDTSVMIQ